MQTIDPSEIKAGMVLMMDGVPCQVEEVHVVGTAKTKHRPHARLRNLKTGHVYERTFPESERLTTAELDHRQVQFSYATDAEYVFLDPETFEELRLAAQQMGEKKWFLLENEEYRAVFLEGKILDIVLPDSVALSVNQTGPPQRGGQISAYKSAILEGGLEVMVPVFIATGDKIRVDTRTRKYLGKEASG